MKHTGTKAASSLCHLRPGEPSSLAAVPGSGNPVAAEEGQVTGAVASVEEGGPLLPALQQGKEGAKKIKSPVFPFFFLLTIESPFGVSHWAGE